MKAIWAIWKASLIEVIRSRLYLMIVAGGVLLVAAALAFSELSVGETLRTLVSIGLAFISIVSVVVAIALSIATLSRDIETRAVIPLLARPLHRWQYIVGRYLGVVSAVATVTLMLGVVLAGLASMFEGKPGAILAAAAFSTLEAAIVAGVAFAMAVRSSAVVSATITVIVFVVGRLDQTLLALIDKGLFGSAAPLMRVVRHILPQLSRFDLTAWAYAPTSATPLLTAGLYALVYAGALVGVGALRFSRRDLL